MGSQINMFKQVLLFLYFLHVCFSSMKTMKEVESYINKWNWDVQCWGENNVVKQRTMLHRVSKECMQMQMKVIAPPSSPIQLTITPPKLQQVPSSSPPPSTKYP